MRIAPRGQSERPLDLVAGVEDRVAEVGRTRQLNQHEQLIERAEPEHRGDQRDRSAVEGWHAGEAARAEGKSSSGGGAAS
jgi:hypothetical protein